jgi:hypothetical protein
MERSNRVESEKHPEPLNCQENESNFVSINTIGFPVMIEKSNLTIEMNRSESSFLTPPRALIVKTDHSQSALLTLSEACMATIRKQGSMFRALSERGMVRTMK